MCTVLDQLQWKEMRFGTARKFDDQKFEKLKCNKNNSAPTLITLQNK
jgi:hypothetical protein